MKSGSLNFLEPSGPLQACNGTALPLPSQEERFRRWKNDWYKKFNAKIREGLKRRLRKRIINFPEHE